LDVPTYQYACTVCSHQLEAVQSFSDDPLSACPECDGRLRKVFSSVGIVFKGSGFYRTDSRSGASSGESTASTESAGASKPAESSGTDSTTGSTAPSSDSGSASSASSSSSSGSSSKKGPKSTAAVAP
jgi:putative FmdB family regulatory protein